MPHPSRRLAAGIATGALLLVGTPAMASSVGTTDTTAEANQPTAASQDTSASQLPDRFLTGYWQNFVNDAEPLSLGEVPEEYDVVAVAFGDGSGNEEGEPDVRYRWSPGGAAVPE